jgi:hypothetical protein
MKIPGWQALAMAVLMLPLAIGPTATAAQAMPPDGDTNAQAATSADGRQTVFVLTRPGHSPHTELWWRPGPGLPPQRLLQERPHTDLKRALIGFNNPVFAPDGRSVYVMTQAWATSNAIHRVDLRSGRIHYVAAGNSVQVVPGGRWAGHLVVMKHKYAPGGGALDHYWLLSPSGRELRKIGASDAQAAAFMAAAGASR